MTFFPTAGNRNHSTGVLSSVGSGGYFWLPCVSGNDAGYVYIDGTRLFLNFNARTLSFPLRCVQEITDCFGDFPSAGYRVNTTGALTNVGSGSYLWSLSPSGTGAYRLYTGSSDLFLNTTNPSNSFPLRCVQEIADCSGNFPSAGCRHNMTGVLTNVGSEGDVWSSMRESTLGLRLIFSGAFATSYGTNRAFGYPLRCVQAFMTCSGMALSVCGASIP